MRYITCKNYKQRMNIKKEHMKKIYSGLPENLDWTSKSNKRCLYNVVGRNIKNTPSPSLNDILKVQT